MCGRCLLPRPLYVLFTDSSHTFAMKFHVVDQRRIHFRSFRSSPIASTDRSTGFLRGELMKYEAGNVEGAHDTYQANEAQASETMILGMYSTIDSNPRYLP